MSDRAGRTYLEPPLVARAAPANDAGVRDPYVARAVASMTREPARKWTVASLARAAGLSRAPLARRFRSALGVSPMRWLIEHRLELARRLLTTDATLAAIAANVGYSSEFALSKSFKRLFGVAPGTWRRRAIAPSVYRVSQIRAAA